MKPPEKPLLVAEKKGKGHLMKVLSMLIGLVIATCSSCSCSFAQQSDGLQPVSIIGASAIIVEVNPCESVATTPTISNCWDCFQSLLTSCDKNNQDAARRAACYKSANDFFTWCLGRIPKVQPVNQVPQANLQTWNLQDGLIVDYSVPLNSTIHVYVRDEFGTQSEAQFVSVTNPDTTVTIFIGQPGGLFLTTNSSAGIVVTAVDKDGNMLGAFASVVNVYEPLDLNNDGVIDGADQMIAVGKYADGTWTYLQFTAWMSDYNMRH